MDAMLGGMTWEEEYNLLTKFHENNLGPAGNKDIHREGETINKSGLAPVGGGKARSLGRGSKMSTHDESVSSRKTSTKNESDVYSDKKSLLTESTPIKKEGQRITTKPKLVIRKSSSSGGKSDSPNPTYEKSMGRGRGLKSRMATAEFPVGVVANMIEKNIGQGHRAGYENPSRMSPKMLKNHNSNNYYNNNATYFPKFDYGQVGIGRGSSWWAAPNAGENRNLEKSKAKVETELGNMKIEKSGTIKVERAILSKWTPLDDSV